ncbi:helix-turn-helix domain-containing protein [Microbacterium sp. NPDC076768]|uniref:PucR family transcriptional regulator n=1 Tax=Microbacterium sp. NPDC076768 TaxID=3154858 RepID=UPI003419D413
MPLNHRATLARVLDNLGDALLDLCVGVADSVDQIGGIVIHDPLDEAVLPLRSIVLGVGLSDIAEICRVIDSLSPSHAIALIVRAPLPDDPAIRAAAARSGLAVLSLRRGASWSHLAALLRSFLVDDIGAEDAESLGGIPSGDLFAVVNAIAALMDAPVTIEDRESRVLAFSARQDEADPSRIETILGRQVPSRYASELMERGVFRELQRSDRPIRVEPLDNSGFSVPRVAAAVRAGDEFLGSIWVAAHEPLSPERETGLQDAAKLAALHMLRVRAGGDAQRRVHADLLSTALEGGPAAHSAMSRLGLADQSVMVLGVALARNDQESLREGAVVAGDRARLADAFAMHLSSTHAGATAALVGDTAYGLIPVSTARTRSETNASPGAARAESAGEERAFSIATEFLERVGRRYSAVIGVAPAVSDVADLAHARTTVDRVLRVLRGKGDSRVARLADVQTEALVLDLQDVASARGDEPTGAVARLLAHDRAHGSELVPTLRLWLETFGDVTAAAGQLYLHRNTFRHRLRRIAEVGCMDLSDPDQRFAALLQLRVLAPTRLPSAEEPGRR